MFSPNMNMQEALLWLSSTGNLTYLKDTRVSKLARMKTLLSLLNNPEETLNLIHVTGSKGKSSTANASAVLLQQRGFHVGLFTSPHIHSYNERIKIDGLAIDDELFLHALYIIRSATETHQIHDSNFHPTTFEKLFAMALVIFREQGIEWTVIEVGIGGTFDSTNVITPKLCIITEIEIEHSTILGATLEEIAHMKGGIIKPSVPVWVGKQNYDMVLPILRTIAAKQHAPCFHVSEHISYTVQKQSRHGIYATIKSSHTLWNNTTVFTPSISTILLDNQLLAFYALQTLLSHPQDTIYFPDTMHLPCRFELIHDAATDIEIYFDGAHTLQSIYHSCECIAWLFSHACLVIALSQDKDHHIISKTLSSYSDIFTHIIVTSAGTVKPSDPRKLYQELQKYFLSVTLVPDEIDAIMQANQYAHTHHTSVCVLGSFYLCSKCRAYQLRIPDNNI